jgi:hypothetical protein
MSKTDTTSAPKTAATSSSSMGAVSVRCLVRRRQKDDAPCVGCETLDLVDDEPPNPAGRSGDEHRRHWRSRHEELDLVRGRYTG